MSLDAAEIKVRVGFWVNRDGEVMEDPVVVDGSFDTTLRASCIQAIKESLPLPPFPDTFTESEQYITYVFTLTR
jgi:outer membrane biosynthesis protein TonB